MWSSTQRQNYLAVSQHRYNLCPVGVCGDRGILCVSWIAGDCVRHFEKNPFIVAASGRRKIEMSVIMNISAYDLHTRIRSPIIFSLMQVKKGEKVLDVGSGSGYLAEKIGEGNEFTCCLDISLENLCTVKERKREKLLLINSAAEKLPLRRESFDKVLCTEVLEHIKVDREALREIARILKPGGVLVITVPCREFRFPSLIELLRVKTVHEYEGPEKHYRKGYTVAELSQLVGETGMVVCDYVYFSHFFSKLILDIISITHLVVRRMMMGQKAWTWADIQCLNSKGSFVIYKLLFPLFLLFCKLDTPLLRSPRTRGSGIAIASRKRS